MYIVIKMYVYVFKILEQHRARALRAPFILHHFTIKHHSKGKTKGKNHTYFFICMYMYVYTSIYNFYYRWSR